MKVTIDPRPRIAGEPVIPGDKSISHRGLLFGALAKGTTEITNLSGGEDVRSTGRCLEQLGVRIESDKHLTRIHGVGLRGFKASAAPLDCGNSGSTMRMFMGFLSGQTFTSTLVGDASLSRRPMARVADPLRQMGASFEMQNGSYAPVVVHGKGRLQPMDYELKVASAQVKSACLLAALYAEGETTLRGLIQSRDHTERLLPYFGVPVEVSSDYIRIRGGRELEGRTLEVPGDPSSAAFWMGAALVAKEGEVRMRNILLNPTRIGCLRVLQRMGAQIEVAPSTESPEPVGRVTVRRSSLKGTTIRADEVPSLIDELPLLAVLATYATGVTEVRGAEELRVKETDRIEAVAENLRRMGATIETFPDGWRVVGPQPLNGARVESFHDHRIAMAFSIAAIGASGLTAIEHAECVSISYPTFFETLEQLS